MSDEVSDFLRSVELLKGRREEEDSARSKELEENILQEKALRKARRAERARSISPQKSSPANTPPPASQRNSFAHPSDGINLAPSPALGSVESRQVPEGHSSDTMGINGDSALASPTKEIESLCDSDVKQTSVSLTSPGLPSSRSPLPWQRRPPSQSSERSRLRPLSMVAAENAAARSSPKFAEPRSATEVSFSRDQTAELLPPKDHSSFKRTTDLGKDPDGYQRRQVEVRETTGPLVRSKLPGISRDSRPEPIKNSVGSGPGTPSPCGKLTGSPLSLSSTHQLDPASKDEWEKSALSPMSLASINSPGGRTSPSRPLSPTKGMGGFVQSAMMKRSDSVKRWSVTSPPGLQRAESVISNRQSVDPARSRPSSLFRGKSAAAMSRLATKDGKGEEQARTEVPAPSRSVVTVEPVNEPDESLPTSPTRTMDPRRWSPTKSSSWLDAALNKQPESGKAKPTPSSANNQPAWMVELNKAKAQKVNSGSVDLGRSPTLPKKPEVLTGGLMRHSPIGTNVKPSELRGFTGVPATEKRAATDFRNKLKRPSRPVSEEIESDAPSTPTSGPGREVSNSPDAMVKKDFRSNLKSRAPPPERPNAEQLTASKPPEEVKNMFGSLRRAKAQNYVAPDELKSNILRGKAGLNTTGGPKPAERKDEFREALLRKKDEFKKAQREGRGVSRNTSSASEASLPEGLLKRMEIGKSLPRRGSTTEVPLESPEMAARSQRSNTVSIASRPSSITIKRASEETDRARLPTPVTDLGQEESLPVRELVAEKKRLPSPSPTRTASLVLQQDKEVGSLQGTVGGLANRFNPALAGLLARGPPALTSSVAKSIGPEAGGGVVRKGTGPGPLLTHMTKSRDRGPKRRAPGSMVKSAGEPETRIDVSVPLEAKESTPVPWPTEVKEATAALDSDESAATARPLTSPTAVVSLGRTPPLAGVPARKSEVSSAFIAPPMLSPEPDTRPASSFSQPVIPPDPPMSEPVTLSSPSASPKSSLSQDHSADPHTAGTSPMEARPAKDVTSSMVTTLQQPRPEPKPTSYQPIPPCENPTASNLPSLSPLNLPKHAVTPADESATIPQTRLEPRPDSVSQPSSPKKLDLKRMSTSADEGSPACPTPGQAKSRPDSPQTEQSNPSPDPTCEAATLPSKARLSPSPITVTSGPAPAPASQTARKPPSFPPSANDRLTIDRLPSPPLPRTEQDASSPTAPSTWEAPKEPPSSENKVDSEAAISVKSGVSLLGGVGLSLMQALRPKVVSEAPVPEPERGPKSRPRQGLEAEQAPGSPTKSMCKSLPKLEQRKSPTKIIVGNGFSTELERPARSPLKGARPLPAPLSPERKASPHITTPMRSPTKYGSEVATLLADFFGTDRPKRDYRVDAADILMRRPAPIPKVHTQNVQLFQISGDGKKVIVPAHHERVLFEREMYLCLHTFVAAGKKTSEVYFWTGDEVPEVAVQDAHVFAQKEARSLGAKLVWFSQGRETSEFLQALGGVVIVRRGSSTKHDSLAPSMLSGRQYLGQVVFDQVEFTPSSLCSGFPYLITQHGKCHLWKGKGSNVDELACARLVGMELALTGDLLEVEDGNESEDFWHIFDGGKKTSSADHWRLKANYDKYCGRLFLSNPADKRQIVEISPYTQTDLVPSSIYVLDAFFEMYIIIGSQSRRQYAAFHNALDFAQEYGILAAGMEDRPFVPVATVVLEGIPRDLKSVFRKWQDSASPTVMNPGNPTTPNLKRGRSLRVIPLTQALQALTG